MHPTGGNVRDYFVVSKGILNHLHWDLLYSWPVSSLGLRVSVEECARACKSVARSFGAWRTESVCRLKDYGHFLLINCKLALQFHKGKQTQWHRPHQPPSDSSWVCPLMSERKIPPFHSEKRLLRSSRLEKYVCRIISWLYLWKTELKEGIFSLHCFLSVSICRLCHELLPTSTWILGSCCRLLMHNGVFSLNSEGRILCWLSYKK